MHRAGALAPYAAPAIVLAWALGTGAGSGGAWVDQLRAAGFFTAFWLPTAAVLSRVRPPALRATAAAAYVVLALYAVWFVETSESSTAALALLGGFVYGLPAAGVTALLGRAWRGSR